MKQIDWWRIGFDHGEASAVAEAIQAGHVSLGPVVAEFEGELAEYLDVPYVVATTSGSVALLMSLWAADVGPGDEVIVPNRTWIATAHAPLLLGANVKLVDVEPDRPVIDVSEVDAAITPKTKAIMAVHMGGRSADMRKLNEIGKRRGVLVIEDAAQALGSSNLDGYLGTQSDMGCFSLSVAKIISTGQGGFIATRSERFYKRLTKMRTHGVGNVVNARWDRPGFNFRFTDILATIGLTQLKLMPERIRKLKEIYRLYFEGLSNQSKIKLIPVNEEADEVPVYIEALCESRDELIAFMAERGIQCRPFYPELDAAGYFKNCGAFPNSRRYGKYGVYLPSGPDQSIEDIQRVVEAAQHFCRLRNLP